MFDILLVARPALNLVILSCVGTSIRPGAFLKDNTVFSYISFRTTFRLNVISMRSLPLAITNSVNYCPLAQQISYLLFSVFFSASHGPSKTIITGTTGSVKKQITFTWVDQLDIATNERLI